MWCSFCLGSKFATSHVAFRSWWPCDMEAHRATLQIQLQQRSGRRCAEVQPSWESCRGVRLRNRCVGRLMWTDGCSRANRVLLFGRCVLAFCCCPCWLWWLWLLLENRVLMDGFRMLSLSLSCAQVCMRETSGYMQHTYSNEHTYLDPPINWPFL